MTVSAYSFNSAARAANRLERYAADICSALNTRDDYNATDRIVTKLAVDYDKVPSLHKHINLEFYAAGHIAMAGISVINRMDKHTGHALNKVICEVDTCGLTDTEKRELAVAINLIAAVMEDEPITLRYI